MQESTSTQKLYKHQIDFLKQNPHRSALIHSCGTGKTRTAIEWAKLEGTPTLVICPKALTTNWQREGKKWGFHVTVMSKEEFRRDSPRMLGTNIKQVIIDECHNGFLTPLFKSQMSKALRSFLKKTRVNRVLLLTATPYTASPWNIFNLAYYCGQEWNYKAFEQTFFNFVRMGPRMIPVAKKGSEVKLAKLLKKFASVVSIEECVDVPPQVFETEIFELLPVQEKEINKAYDPLPIVRFTKAHQVASGVIKGNEYVEDRMDIPNLKDERILSLCEENEKVIVVCRYNLQIDHLRELLTSKLKKPIFVIRGDVKDRDAVIQQAEKSPRAVVLIQAACSAGYELPSFGLMVFASMDFSFVNYKQMQGRILRINNLHKNVYLHLVCGEVDVAIMEAMDRKEDFDMELYAKKRG